MNGTHNEGRVLFWILLGITVVVVGIFILLFILFSGEDEEIRTVEKDDDAEIVGGFDPTAPTDGEYIAVSEGEREDTLLRQLRGGSGGGVSDGSAGVGGPSGTDEPGAEVYARYYAALDLAPGASREEIEAAYNLLREQYGPGGRTYNRQRFSAIVYAYNVLTGRAPAPGAGSGGGSSGAGFGGSGIGFGGSGAGGGVPGITPPGGIAVPGGIAGPGSVGTVGTVGTVPGVTGPGVPDAPVGSVFRRQGTDSFTPSPVRSLKFPGIQPPTIRQPGTRAVPLIIPPTVNIPGASGGPRDRGGGDDDREESERRRIGSDRDDGEDRGRDDEDDEDDKNDFKIGDILAGIAVTTAVKAMTCIGGNLLGGVVSAANPLSVSTLDGGNIGKECTLDSLAFGAAKQAGLRMVAEYINWAVDGFRGKPLFIQNPSQFWNDFTDNEIGRALEDGGLGFLCDVNGIRIDISNLLQLKYRRISIEPPRCRLSDYRNNIEQLLDNPVTVVGNPVSIEEEDPLVFGRGEYTFYSGTINFRSAVTDDEEVFGDWDIAITHRNGRGQERTENTVITITNTNDVVRTFRGRADDSGTVTIRATKEVYAGSADDVEGEEYSIEVTAEIGNDVLRPTLRDRFGIENTDTITINPLELLGITPIDANKQLDRASEHIAQNVRRIAEVGSVLTQVGRADRGVERIQNRVGVNPSVAQTISNSSAPNVFASYECGDGDIDEDGACLNPTVLTNAAQVQDTAQQHIGAQIQAVNEADEFGEVVNAALNATVLGIFRNFSGHNATTSWRGGGRKEFEKTIKNIPLDTAGDGWWTEILDETDTFKDIIIADTLVRDADKLFGYISESIAFHVTNERADERRISAEDNGHDSGDRLPPGYTPFDGGGYKPYADGLEPTDEGGFINYAAVEKFHGGRSFTTLLNAVRSERSFSTCTDGSEEHDRTCTTENLTAFSHPTDRKTFRSAAETASQEVYVATIQFLREIYESTIIAHTRIAGDAAPGGNETDGVAKTYRTAILKKPSNAGRLKVGATEFTVVRDDILDSFIDSGDAKIYVDTRKRHLVFLGNDCSRDPNAPGDIGGTYAETTCTINDFERIVDEKLRHIPQRTEKLIYLYYAFARQSGLIPLPTASAQDILTSGYGAYTVTNIERNRRYSELYRKLGEVFAGENSGVALTAHWGSFTAKSAEEEYEKLFRKKTENMYTRTVFDFSNRISEENTR